jgi:hypothetical protein
MACFPVVFRHFPERKTTKSQLKWLTFGMRHERGTVGVRSRRDSRSNAPFCLFSYVVVRTSTADVFE